MTKKIIAKFTDISARTAALIAGFGLLAMTMLRIPVKVATHSG